MNRFKVGAMIFCLALVALAFPPGAKADEWNKKTTVTFSAPVEIPGVGAQVLPAGTYVFKLLDSQSDRHIVQIFNERRRPRICNHPCDSELPFEGDRQNGHDVQGKGGRSAGSHQGVVLSRESMGPGICLSEEKSYRAGEDYKPARSRDAYRTGHEPHRSQ